MYKMVKCRVCGKDYKRRVKHRAGGIKVKKFLRSRNTITCSPECSRKYSHLRTQSKEWKQYQLKWRKKNG